MGTRGPVGKPADRAQGHRAHDLVPIEQTVDLKANPPKPPTGLLKAHRDSWMVFWRSGIAALIQETDLPALQRLWELRDQRDRFLKLAKKAPLVKGSTGQVRVNPASDQILKLESKIETLESRFGLSLEARARLGIEVGQAAMTLEQLNRMMMAEDDDDDPRDDPREDLVL